MKLNLGCGDDLRSGYINVDIFPSSNECYRQGDMTSLDWLTEDGVVDEIIALDCIEYLPINEIQSTITNWIKKLVSGGVLKILVPDCYATAKAFYQGQLSLQEYSQITFGTQTGTDKRLSMIDTTTMISLLEEAGMTISTKRYEGIAIYVEAVK